MVPGSVSIQGSSFKDWKTPLWTASVEYFQVGQHGCQRTERCANAISLARSSGPGEQALEGGHKPFAGWSEQVRHHANGDTGRTYHQPRGDQLTKVACKSFELIPATLARSWLYPCGPLRRRVRSNNNFHLPPITWMACSTGQARIISTAIAAGASRSFSIDMPSCQPTRTAHEYTVASAMSPPARFAACIVGFPDKTLPDDR